jgi:hypothetical protein
MRSSLVRAALLWLLSSPAAAGADYAYSISWVDSPQPPGVTIIGHRIEWRRCDNPAQSYLIYAFPLSSSAVVVSPLDRYCWNVIALSSTKESDPSATVVFHSSPDTDSDGILDSSDNCTLAYNPQQVDSDVDGYGNRCDGDLDGNKFVSAADVVLFRAQLGKPSVAPVFNPADFDANGWVNAFDTAIFRSMIGKPPGPKGELP